MPYSKESTHAVGNITPESSTATGRDAHLCTVRTSPVEFAASLGEAGTNRETMGSLCFSYSAGT